MSDLPKFMHNNPTNKEQKLIVELVSDLDATTKAFMKLNHKGNITHDMFCILRDAAIGYCGGMIRDLGKILVDKNQIESFTKEAKEIFYAYIEEIERKLKCSTN